MKEEETDRLKCLPCASRSCGFVDSPPHNRLPYTSPPPTPSRSRRPRPVPPSTPPSRDSLLIRELFNHWSVARNEAAHAGLRHHHFERAVVIAAALDLNVDEVFWGTQLPRLPPRVENPVEEEDSEDEDEDEEKEDPRHSDRDSALYEE